MPTVCFYAHLHQPFRLRNLNVFDIGNMNQEYFAGETDENKTIFLKVSQKSYRPMLSLLMKLLQQHDDFSCALSITGVFLEQAKAYDPWIISKISEMVATERVEILAETYHHSLASLYSSEEFSTQVKLHEDLVVSLFGVRPTAFRNTELIYSNDVAVEVAKLGYEGMLTEAVERYLWDRPRTQLYYSYPEPHLPLLLKHAQLSDDIAFRFSDRNWAWHPLSAEQYLHWVEIYPEDQFVNLFMDFETFGEHQWEDTGIFQFFEHFVKIFLERPWNSFKTPTQIFREHALVTAKDLDNWQDVIENNKAKPGVKGIFQDQTSQVPDHLLYDVPEPISWADVDRDTTAWNDNALQQDTIALLYDLEQKIKRLHNPQLLATWRKLQTSDHFYYMCTKWAADGDVHAYFSPYESPYEAFRLFSIALSDFRDVVEQQYQYRKIHS